MASVSVHVTGLPSNCEDAAVEAELREALDKPMGTCGLLAIDSKPSCPPLADLLASLEDEPQGRAGGAAAPETCEASAEETATSAKATEGGAELENQTEASADGHEAPAHDDAAAEVEGTEATAQGASEPTENATEDAEVTLLSDSCYSCTVPRNKKGESKGFCFLEFLTLESAETAIYILNAGVQIAGSVVSAQLARQGGPVSEGKDRHIKEQRKAGKFEKEQAVFYSPMSIKHQGYNKNIAPGEPGGPPLRKNGARPIYGEKSAGALLKQVDTKIKQERAKAVAAGALSLEDAERHLRLKNK